MEPHRYEKNQDFNLITRFLHATRFRYLERIVRDLTPRFGSKLRVLDIGCGPCRSYRLMTEWRDDIDYTGVELREDFCALAAERYGGRNNFRLHRADIAEKLDLIDGFDLVIGLETFEHIPEHKVVRVVEAIGRSDFQKLFITVPNEIGPAVAIKNTGSALMGYIRHRQYTWTETFYASICELDRVRPHGTEHIGFDWRWLAQTLRHNVRIVKKYRFPFQFVPKAVSPTIGFLCERRPGMRQPAKPA
ncbi:MAG: class I SAM-dependent methyltransferase [Rhodobacter sp.]|nr:class I SAM-dependent methyltransferase [Rhodobacter sp.]